MHAICYHIYSSQATIFYFSDKVHFSARSLTYEVLRWAFLMDHFCISGLLYSPMPGPSLRTLKFEDWYSHLCYFRAVVDAQWYSGCPVIYQYFLIEYMVFQMDYIAWIWLSILYGVMVIIALILILVTYIDLWYYDLAVIFIWTWLYIIICNDVLTLALKFSIYTHWFYPP